MPPKSFSLSSAVVSSRQPTLVDQVPSVELLGAEIALAAGSDRVYRLVVLFARYRYCVLPRLAFEPFSVPST